MSYLLGLLTGIILMVLISRDTNKISIDSRCPDIHIAQPQINTVFEESFKECMRSFEKCSEKKYDLERDVLFWKSRCESSTSSSYTD